MKINENDPLPRHTKYDWEECYAKVVLETLVKDRVNNLKIKDKPDLQNEAIDVGIECTIAIDKKQLEAEYLYCELTDNKSKNPEKCKERIEELGGKITKYTMVQSGTDNTSNLFRAVDKKLKKLNSENYKIFKNNFLLIRDCIYIPNEHIKGLQYLIAMIQSKYDREFDIIYILLNSKLIELNMIDYTNRYFEISSNIQYELAQQAREFVIKHEEGE